MLDKILVAEEEEALRGRVNQLNNAQRKQFYARAQKELKDPDTYAVLNWSGPLGFHHFYLGRWYHGLFDISLVLIGIFLLIAGYSSGFILILLNSVFELFFLFRSQVIIQDWNNRIYKKIINELTSS